MTNKKSYIKVNAIQGPKNASEVLSLKELTLRHYATRGFFFPTAAEHHMISQLHDDHQGLAEVDTLNVDEESVLQQVVYGNEDLVLQIITLDPTLVEKQAKVRDYSGREVVATPFQAALLAGDEQMANKIKKIYLRERPENGQGILENQFFAIFTEGYAAHLAEQKHSANQFEHDYLNPLINAFDGASRADVEAAKNKLNNGSALCQRIKEFKESFQALSHQEKVYNPHHLLNLLKIYISIFPRWYGKLDHDPWAHLDLFWCQVIGWGQRFMPSNYAQAICTKLKDIIEHKRPLTRTLKLELYNHMTSRCIDFFPLDDSNSQLGSDFAVYSCSFPCNSHFNYERAGEGGAADDTVANMLRWYKELVSIKVHHFENILQPEPLFWFTPRR